MQAIWDRNQFLLNLRLGQNSCDGSCLSVSPGKGEVFLGAGVNGQNSVISKSVCAGLCTHGLSVLFKQVGHPTEASVSIMETYLR
jgi:hypothetical protein